MHYIAGLGNPGKEYEGTRHNIGFYLLQNFVESLSFPSFHSSSAYSALVSEGNLQGSPVVALLPQIFMNESGKSVAKMLSKEESASLAVVYDDIDLPFGEIKISFGRGDGGHNGIKSIIASLGTQDFTRIRVGIGQKSLWTGKIKRPKGQALAGYVLGNFTAKEKKDLPGIAQKVNEALVTFVKEGKDAAMNAHN